MGQMENTRQVTAFLTDLGPKKCLKLWKIDMSPHENIFDFS